MNHSTIASHWRSPLVISQLIYYVLMGGLGLCIQENILEANPWARSFSDAMASVVPQIDRITALHLKPDVNRFYFSMLWATSPVLLGLLFANVYRTRSALARVWGVSLTEMLLSMCGLALLLGWTQYLWFVEPSMRLSKLLFSTSVGRSFFGQFLLYIGAVFCLAGLMIWCLGWISGRISNNIKEQHDE